MAVVFYSSFVCISAYANVYLKTILQECLRAGLPSGFPSTAPVPVLVPAVLGTLAVWIPNQKKKSLGSEQLCSFCGAFCGAKACGKMPRGEPRKGNFPAKIQTWTPKLLPASSGDFASTYYD